MSAMATYTRRDTYYRKAREKGLPSRAAFKIEEILARFRLVKPGARIIDLGCAPGGWLVILARATGPSGLVAGVDLEESKPPAANVLTIAGDIREAVTVRSVIEKLGGPADLVTSDLAPKLSGIAERDDSRMRELIESAIWFAERTLKQDGAMVAKLFMGREFEAILDEFRGRFRNVEVTRTKATRPGSSELYIIARGFRP
jgi:23S rRNA (uridine2552-2'-O)-methyltransferase